MMNVINSLSIILGAFTAAITMIVMIVKAVQHIAVVAGHLKTIAESHESLVSKMDDLTKALTSLLNQLPGTDTTQR